MKFIGSRRVLLACCLLFTVASYSQTPGVAWNKAAAGNAADVFKDISRLSNGDFICSGYTTSTTGVGTGNKGGSDFLLQCISEQGQQKWTKLIGGSGQEGGSYDGNAELTSPTPDGGFFFAGAASSSDGDIPATKGELDIFLARFDAGGNILWKRTYGGPLTEYVSDLEVTADGGCIIMATSVSNNSGDVPANHGNNSGDAWVIKLDASGNIQWSKMLGGSGGETGQSIELTPDGAYLLGIDVSSEDGDLTGTIAPGSFVRSDVWIVKMDTTGGIIWQKRFTGTDEDNGVRIAVSANNVYYVACGSRSNNGDFLANKGLYDVYVLKLSAAGDLLWNVNAMNGLAWDSPSGIIVAPDGRIVVSATTYSSSFNGVGFPSRGGSDIGICKLDSVTGSMTLAFSMGGNGGDFVRDIISTENNELLLVGQTASVDQDFAGYTASGNNAFAIKLAALNGIRGYVYYDLNGNNRKDDDEALVNNIHVVSAKKDRQSVSSYTHNGYYFNEVDTGTFVTKPRIVYNKQYFTVTPDSVTSTFASYYQQGTANFALRAIPGQRDLRTVIVGLDAARAGFEAHYKLLCYNAGTDTVPAGMIRFVKDHRVTVRSASPAASATNADTLQWAYTDLKPFDTLAFFITVEIARPPAVNFGDWLKYSSSIDPIDNDRQKGDNKFYLFHLVTGSFDPNDKMESHGDRYTTADLRNNEFLNYTIRFQNTGTDTAFTVVIKDTLSDRLDWQSMEVLSASHDYSFKIVDGRYCSWTFNRINLPDSNRNEPASHGYINFRIKPAGGLKAGDAISNSAAIYFDYNEPVITNTHVTVIQDTLAAPVLYGLQQQYCSAGTLAGRVINLPAANSGIQVSLKLDASPLTIQRDSSFMTALATLNAGAHTITLTYANGTETTTATHTFTVTRAAVPDVNVSANITVVTSLTQTLTITAANNGGGGSAPLFTFSRNRDMTQLLQAESSAANININPANLQLGANRIFVRMRTSEVCYTTLTNIDSIQIIRDQVTAVIDVNNPGAQILAYPNPVSTDLYIGGLSSNRKYHLQLYTLDGRLLRTEMIVHKDRFVLPVSAYTAGAYVLAIRETGTQQLVRSIKFIKR